MYLEQVIVEGLNIVKKHRKPNNSNETGGIIETEAPINASNVMFLVDGKTSRKVVRVEKKKTTKSKENETSVKEDKPKKVAKAKTKEAK